MECGENRRFGFSFLQNGGFLPSVLFFYTWATLTDYGNLSAFGTIHGGAVGADASPATSLLTRSSGMSAAIATHVKS
jgi:hypothetical protein